MVKLWPLVDLPLILSFFARQLGSTQADYLLYYFGLLYGAISYLQAQPGSSFKSLDPLPSCSSTPVICSRTRTSVSKIVCMAGLLLWAGVLPADEQEASTAQAFESGHANPAETTARPIESEKQVRTLLDDKLALWNAHDIDGYLKLFWASDQLLVVQDGVPIFGWQKLRERYLRFYADRNQMRTMTLEGIKIEVFDDNFVQALCWWSSNWGGRKSPIVDITLFRRFSEGWTIVAEEIFD